MPPITTYPQDAASAMRLNAPRVCLYDAAQEANHFCHHGQLGVFGGRIYAMWSNGHQGEGEIGQRILYASSQDGLQWSRPQVLLENVPGPETPLTLVPAGFWDAGDRLVAYAGAFCYAHPRRKQQDASGEYRYGVKCTGTRLLALTSTDGVSWSQPLDLNVPLCPNMGPQRLRSGRLLITGNWAHAYSDDPSGIGSWTLTGYCRDEACQPKPLRDDPFALWEVSRAMGYPGALCEGAFLQTEDGVLHMLHRSYTPFLYESLSLDDGATWSEPVRTDFQDGNSKFFLGRLPDGQYCYIGNPGPGNSRCPLVLSLSRDGQCFNRHFILEDTPTVRKFPGVFKNGMYAYPHAVVMDDTLYVIYTLWKEDVFVQKIPLGMLSAEF